jgi:hypothetical protein
MTDPLTIATTSIGLLKSTTEALNALRERAQRSKDVDIKEQINTLYDNVLGLKEVVSRLLDENKELHRRLAEQQHPPEKPKIKQVGETNYYFDSEGGPYCQPCYDDKKKLVALTPQKRNSGGVCRECKVCKQTFYEQRVNSPPTQVGGRWTPWS